jgi:V8-like Glu-specific endopeptidase
MEKDFRMKFSLVLVSTFVLSFSVFAATKGIDVIYGEDNRKDVFESTNASFIELSKSTAAMIPASNLKQLLSDVEVSGTTLRGRGICAKERFSNQISAANCSGFLVADNKLVTAGHCIKGPTECASYKWVFDYRVESSDQGKITVPASSVYSCKRVIATRLDSLSKDDYALIELDRPVTDRQPLKIRRAGKPSVGDSLVVIGHPTGLPTKIADGAKIRSLNGKFFIANLDTYGGNSGSAVFNVDTEEVEGILVRGENDYVQNSTLGCKESNICPENGCRGEDVTYIANVPGIFSL